MIFSEIQNKDLGELQVMLKEAKIKLGRLKFDLANKALKDSSQIKKARKDIAQLLTAINKITSK